MDRTAGCVTGGEEIYLLCDKVQKGKSHEYCEAHQGVHLEYTKASCPLFRVVPL